MFDFLSFRNSNIYMSFSSKLSVLVVFLLGILISSCSTNIPLFSANAVRLSKPNLIAVSLLHIQTVFSKESISSYHFPYIFNSSIYNKFKAFVPIFVSWYPRPMVLRIIVSGIRAVINSSSDSKSPWKILYLILTVPISSLSLSTWCSIYSWQFLMAIYSWQC